MRAWTTDELNKIGSAEEIQIAPQRPDGSVRERVTVWCVPLGDGLDVRSAVHGRGAAWYRGVKQTHRARIWAAGVQKDVDFTDGDASANDAVDSAYRTKYRRYAGRILNSCLTPEARETTLRVMPRTES